MHNLFDSDGPLMRVLSDLQMLVCLNLLTLIYSIPIVTAGAALAAMHYVFMDRIEGVERPLFSEYHRRFRQNFKNATPIWLILFGSFIILFLEYRMISGELFSISRLVAVPVALGMYTCAAVYIYAMPLTARFENKMTATLKNAVILAVTHVPRTFLSLAFLVFIPYLLVSVSRLLPLFFFVGISFPSYLQALLYMPLFRELER